MKKVLWAVALALLLSLSLAGCTKTYDYTVHLSEVRRDIFRAETEAFEVTLSCVEREHPYASDGIACPKSKLMEAVLIPADKSAENFTLTLGGEDWGGEMSFRSVEDDWFFSASCENFPSSEVTVTVEWDGQKQDIVATTVKNEGTMSAEEALEIAIGHEEEAVKALTKDGVFTGELRVRLLRRDVNYYYVGIIAPNGKTISLLLGAESGEVLARRESA